MARTKMLSKDWYEKMYATKEGRLGWDIGKPQSGLMELLDGDSLPSGRVLIPGCGLAHNAIAFAEKGFDVLAFDFSTHAIRRAKQKARRKQGLKLTFAVEDIYALPELYDGAFDYVIEIGNLQAMSVKERREYVRVLDRVLVPSGKCIVICKKYPPLTPGPKGVKRKALSNYFSRSFKVERIDRVLMYRDCPPLDGYRLIAKKKPRAVVR